MLETIIPDAAAVSPVYPGYPLRTGSYSSEVARIQSYLNALRAVKYPNLTSLTVDGRFGAGTARTVQEYQAIHGLKIDGVVGAESWNTLIGEYNAVLGGSADTYPGMTLRPGQRSEDVRHMQTLLNQIAITYTAINPQTVDGAYGNNMSAAVRRFQQQFGLSADGLLGVKTWEKIVEVYGSLSGQKEHVVTPYPGTVLTTGSSGDFVRYVQSYLNAIQGRPLLTVDGLYGQNTARIVGSFQASRLLKADGKVGPATWRELIPAFNSTL